MEIWKKKTKLKIKKKKWVGKKWWEYLLDHSDGEAFLEAAELAAVAAALIDGTVAIGQTHVLGSLLHRSLEESLAALAGAHAVVLARRVVAAHAAQLRRRLGP